MIYNEETYYVGYHRNVRELGAVPALIFDTIAGLIYNSDGCIGNDTIAELLGITERYLRQQLDVLIRMGYIDKVPGNGRGKKTTYILTKKGEQNAPLYAKKGGTKRHEKGEQNDPLKEKDNNKDNIIINMEDFVKFWDLFKVDDEHYLERERCERLWYVMPEDKRQSVIRDLEDGHKPNKTKSPFVYLRYYEKPLRYMRQGTKVITLFFVFYREHSRRIQNRIFAHLLVGLKAHTFDDACLARDMNGRIRIDAVGLLVPDELGRIELLALAVERVHITTERPDLRLLIIIRIIGLQRGLYRQVVIELLQVHALGKLLVRRIGLIVQQPLRCLDPVPRHA